MNKRLDWLDIAKALGIILVVIAHSLPESFFKLWIYSFHMPLFFFISGIFINYNFISNESSDNFILKKIKTIFIPYFYFGIINTVFLIPVWGLTNTIDSLKYSGISGGPTWFLFSLFLSEILIYILINNTKNNFYFLLLLIASLIIGYFLDENNIIITLYLSNIFISVFFVGVGFLLGKYIIKYNAEVTNVKEQKYIYILLIILIASFVVNYLTVIQTSTRLDIIYNKLGNPITMILGAFSGILFLFAFSILISNIKIQIIQDFLSYIGKNTLIIFALHMIVNLNYTVYMKPFFTSTLMYVSSKFIVTWLIMFLFIYLINNFMPFLIGRKKLKENSYE